MCKVSQKSLEQILRYRFYCNFGGNGENSNFWPDFGNSMYIILSAYFVQAWGKVKKNP